MWTNSNVFYCVSDGVQPSSQQKPFTYSYTSSGSVPSHHTAGSTAKHTGTAAPPTGPLDFDADNDLYNQHSNKTTFSTGFYNQHQKKTTGSGSYGTVGTSFGVSGQQSHSLGSGGSYGQRDNTGPGIGNKTVTGGRYGLLNSQLNKWP